MLQVYIRSKCSNQLRVAIQIGASSSHNVMGLPKSPLRESVFREDEKIIAHFMKVDPHEPWGSPFTISVEISNKDQVTPSQQSAANN